jgi:hypothetical protein
LTGEFSLESILDKIVSKYSEFKEFNSEEEAFSAEDEDVDMDIDYRQEIIKA